MDDRKFYRTLVTVELLSEGKPADLDLGSAIDDAIGEGRIIHDVKSEEVTELDAATMAKALHDARSYPGFFDLDEYEVD